MYGDFINYAAIQETLKSYDEGLQKMFAVCKNARPTTFSWHEGLPADWHITASVVRREDLMPHITELFTRVHTLSEYGRPKSHVGSHTKLLTITAYATYPFKMATVRCAIAGHDSYVDEDGYYHPATERQPQTVIYSDKQIRLHLFEKDWTVKDWKQASDNVGQFLGFATDRIQTKFAEAVAKAASEIETYNQLIQKLQTI